MSIGGVGVDFKHHALNINLLYGKYYAFLKHKGPGELTISDAGLEFENHALKSKLAWKKA